MRVVIKKTEDEIIQELFGPIQEAARKPYLFDLDPKNTWCDLSELRLSALVCEFKPIGINRQFNLLAITERMNKIIDDEPPQSEIYLAVENKVAYRAQQKDLLRGNKPERVTYPPKYLCRPTLEMVMEKLNSWYGMKMCENNESYPAPFAEGSEYQLTDYILAEKPPKQQQEEASSTTETAQLRKKKNKTPEA